MKIRLLFVLLLPLALLAQESMIITGRITNLASLEPMPNSNVMIIGMPIGAAASSSGLYRIEIPLTRIKRDSITISVNHIGYKSAVLTIPVVPGPNIMDFYLTEDAIVMKEIVKTAAAWVEPTEEEKARGYSVETINIEELRQSATDDPLAALKGKIAGIVVDAGNMIGKASRVQLRGVKYLDLNSSREPLLVVDGVPFRHDYAIEGGQSYLLDTINDIGLSNIAKIEVVKGQGMFWKYGSAAANGCIIITTKAAGANK